MILDVWIPWIIITSSLLALLLLGATVANWLQARHERRELRRLMTPHHHRFHVVGESVEGLVEGECVCGERRMYEEVLT